MSPALLPGIRVERRLTDRDLNYATPCRVFEGMRDGYGYGRSYLGRDRRGNSTYTMAHRSVWELHNGPIPEHLRVDHLCCDPAWCTGGRSCPHRACCEVTHLALRPNRDNVLRGNGPSAVNARKTHCAHGHEFTRENTRVRPDGARACRACRRERDYLSEKRRRAAANNPERLLAEPPA